MGNYLVTLVSSRTECDRHVSSYVCNMESPSHTPSSAGAGKARYSGTGLLVYFTIWGAFGLVLFSPPSRLPSKAELIDNPGHKCEKMATLGTGPLWGFSSDVATPISTLHLCCSWSQAWSGCSFPQPIICPRFFLCFLFSHALGLQLSCPPAFLRIFTPA